MPPITATPSGTSQTDEQTPRRTARRLQHELNDLVREANRQSGEIAGLVEELAHRYDDLRSAVEAHHAARLKLEVLARLHGLDVASPYEVDTEDPSAALKAAAELDRTFAPSRLTRSGRTVLDHLETAVSGGDVEEARRRVRQLRERLDSPTWLTIEAAESAWIAPARQTARDRARAALRRRALRWARSSFHGDAIGPLRDEDGEPRFPEPVMDVLEAFAARPGSWSVPQRWYSGPGVPPASLSLGDHDLEAELRGTVEELPADAPEGEA